MKQLRQERIYVSIDTEMEEVNISDDLYHSCSYEIKSVDEIPNCLKRWIESYLEERED